MTDTPILFALDICSFHNKGIGKNRSMKSTMMLQNPNIVSTLGAEILHTVVGSIRTWKLKAPANGLQEKQTKRTVTRAQTVMKAPIAHEV